MNYSFYTNKILKLLALFIHLILCLAYTKSIRGETQFFLEPNIYNIQELSKDRNEESYYRDRVTDTRFRLGIKAEWDSDLAYLRGALSFVGNGNLGNQAQNSEENHLTKIFLERDAFVGFPFLWGDLWIGRQSFFETPRNIYPDQLMPRNLDGGDGIGFTIRYGDATNLQIFAWDYYAGFPVWYYNQTEIYGSKEKRSQLQGERYRQGFRLIHSKGNWNLGGDFFYLNLGNWARSSADDQSLIQNEGGDGDFLLRYRGMVEYDWDSIFLGLEYHITRGLDKTFASPLRPERSLPIRGEAVVLRAGGGWEHFFFKILAFLPNTPTTEESLEPTSIGYVGMGNPYSKGHFLSRERNIYPAAWVTQWGKEWNQWDRNSLKGNRATAGFFSVDAGIKFSHWTFSVSGEYFLPRKIIPYDKGNISIRKTDYENYFLAEVGVGIFYGVDSERLSSGWGLEFSRFWSQEDLGLKGNFIHVFGRFVF